MLLWQSCKTKFWRKSIEQYDHWGYNMVFVYFRKSEAVAAVAILALERPDFVNPFRLWSGKKGGQRPAHWDHVWRYCQNLELLRDMRKVYQHLPATCGWKIIHGPHGLGRPPPFLPNKPRFQSLIHHLRSDPCCYSALCWAHEKLHHPLKSSMEKLRGFPKWVSSQA